MNKLNLRKLQHIAGLALQNGIRLHFDSIVLLKNKSYPSALFLSVIAMEEIWKAFSADHFAWSTKINGRDEHKFEEKWINNLFWDHKYKQISFLRNTHIKMAQKKEHYIFAESKELDKLKQDAIYVGIRSTNISKNKTDGRINNPSKMSIKKCLAQVNLVQNFLTQEIELIETWAIEHDLAIFKKIFSTDLLNKLAQQKIN